ncbi:MAG: hypothetical protein Q9227_006503 [Pyrenula ochraceoflavens]
MRRTLVSRKARKRRIAENAEMSGENYYTRQNTLPKLDMSPPLSPDGKPMVNGAPGSDNLPSFATYDSNRRTSEDRVPLNQRSPSTRPPGPVTQESRDGSERYGPPGYTTQRSPKDEFGNPLPPGASDNQPPLRRDPSDPRMRDQYMNQGMRPLVPPPPRGAFRGFGPRGRGGYGPPRGRGGYPPAGPYGPGPGGFDPRGPPQGYPPRGGFGPRGRGGYGPPRGRGGYPPPGPYGPGPATFDPRGPPQGMRDQARGIPPTGQVPPNQEPPNQYDIIDDYSRSTLYSRQTQDMTTAESSQPPPLPGQPPTGGRGESPYGARQQSPGGQGRLRQPTPPQPMPEGGTVGQAVEMDASTGRSSDLPSSYGPPGNRVRASDDEIQGMIGLQQGRREGMQSPTSMYSQAEYVPPRLAWARKNSSPLNGPPGIPNPADYGSKAPQQPTHSRAPSTDNYYEDIDPRFAEPERRSPNHPQALTAGNLQQPGGDGSYEDLPEGARSPAASDTSHFTSVSQRGVNPNWRPGPADMNMMPNRKPVQRQQDFLLGNNPDFQLPGAGGRGRGGMMGRGGRMPVVPSEGGRYPPGM